MPFVCYGTISTINPVPIPDPGISSYTTLYNGYITNTGGYTVISYTDPVNTGTFNVTGISGTATVYYLAVGGGGGTSCDYSGGGGGGAVTYGTFTLSSTTNINITVGTAGGYILGTITNTGSNGGNTIISGSGITTITAGGGYASKTYGSIANSTPSTVTFGGCGSGASSGASSNPAGNYGGTANARTYFNQGGSSVANPGGAGGGGGAGGSGGNATSAGGTGGIGIKYSSFSTDTSNYNIGIDNVLALLPGYGSGSASGFLGAGGGGGGYTGGAGAGGSNGAGGNGSSLAGSSAANGTTATVYGGGGGGCGAASNNQPIAGKGYQGIVMLAFSSSVTIPFTPQSIPGLRLWLDPTDSSTITIASGTSVSQWNDKSGNGYNFTSASTYYPSTGTKQINNKNIMDFTSSTNYMTSATLPFGPTYSIFIVAYTTTLTQNILIRASQNAVLTLNTSGPLDNFGYYGSYAGNGSTWYTANTNNTPTVSLYNNLSIAELTNNTTVITPYVNGTIQNTKQTGTNYATGLYLGNLDPGTGNQSWKGYIGDVVIYNSVLLEANRRKIEGYLAHKWGIQSSLPSSHQFYSSAPTSTSTGYSVSIPSGVTGGAPVLYYPFSSDTKNYATGTGVEDLQFVHTSTNADVAYSTNAFYADSGQKGSLYCQNTGSSVWLPNLSVNTSSGFTIMLWFYSTSTAYNMIWRSDTLGYFFWNGSSGVTFNIFSNSITISNLQINTWYHITYVHPGSNGTPYVLLNNSNKILNSGTVTNSANITKNVLFGDSSAPTPWTGLGMLGYINNFYFFTRGLSASEITAIYNQ